MNTLLINAKVWLGKNSFAHSLGFNSLSEKINFTGSDEQAKNIKNKYDEVIDMHKKLILPAFTDGHCHFIKGAFVNSQLNLREAKTKKDFINGIREYKDKNGNNWIYGGYFSETNFTEDFIPDKSFLDDACSDIPVIISKFDMHSAFANSKALEISGILSKQNNFTSEEIVKDKNNLITGELKERARDFVMQKIPAVSLKERTEIVINQMQKFHSFGIAAISDITLVEDLEIYKELIIQNKLQLRVDARLPFQEFYNLNKYKKEFEKLSDLIKFNSLKAFYDGSLSSRTALMHSNYKYTKHNGIKTEFVNSGEFEKLAYEIDQAGIQMSVHAIGDKAVSELLDLNELLIKKFGKRDRRFRIEHAQHIRENDFRRFKELNVIASVQPTHLFSDAKTAFEIIDDYKLEHNYKKLFDIGAKVCYGTDFPVVGESPFETIFYAMTRKVNGFENGFVTENNISLEDCLEAYTFNNAYATYEENVRGSLEIGKAADIVIMEDDLFVMTGEEIKDAKVFETYLNGKKIF
ncbi:MAG: amidohydrolase [Bacteroidota bacterium]|nr:amidohydrolase [Bacteroidota bacterium]